MLVGRTIPFELEAVAIVMYKIILRDIVGVVGGLTMGGGQGHQTEEQNNTPIIPVN